MKTLLIIDMQKGFMKNDKYLTLNEKIENLVKNTQYDKIFMAKFFNDTKQNPLYQEKVGWKGLTNKKEQTFSIKVPKNATIFEKYGYGLKNEQLDMIKTLDIKEMDICGIKAEACVYTIALQLWDAKIFPNILINYIEGEHDMKEIFIKQFGSVDERR